MPDAAMILRQRADAYDTAARDIRDHPRIAEDCAFVARELRWAARREERDKREAA